MLTYLLHSYCYKGIMLLSFNICNKLHLMKWYLSGYVNYCLETRSSEVQSGANVTLIKNNTTIQKRFAHIKTSSGTSSLV
jgi:hypothetical protein